MGEMPDGSFEFDEPPKAGAHQAWWMALSPLERVVHYNRNLPKGCTHKASLLDWPVELREAYSFDPYAHTAHLRPHKSVSDCDCQTCDAKFGLIRDRP